MKQVIVNADDFGAAPGINQGIVDAHNRGIVTSTTVMINMPYAAAGLELAHRDARTLGLGLHVTLTAGRPISPPEKVASLVDGAGEFWPISAWVDRLAQFEPDHLAREIAAQVERFGELAGHAPDHLDAHHHAAYLHPAAFRELVVQAHRLGIPMREAPTVMGRARAMALLRDLLPGLDDRRAKDMFNALDAVVAEGPAPFCPAQLTTAFWDSHATLGDLLLILTALPDDRPLEIMCHPGYMDDVLAAHRGYTARRQDEFDHLTHRATLECVRAEGIQLISFAAISRE